MLAAGNRNGKRLMTRIAFIGFGEAAQAMAAGLSKEPGVEALSAFDLRFSDAAQSPDLVRRAEERKVRVGRSMEDAVAGADVVLSLVVGSAAAKVGEEAGTLLKPGQIFVDLNSIGPDAKKRVGEALAKGGRADFVEGAVMARVPPQQHKTPILRPEIIEAIAQRADGDHLLVYQSGRYEALEQALAATGLEARIYGMRPGATADGLDHDACAALRTLLFAPKRLGFFE